jgi:hypothetical protein
MRQKPQAANRSISAMARTKECGTDRKFETGKEQAAKVQISKYQRAPSSETELDSAKKYRCSLLNFYTWRISLSQRMQNAVVATTNLGGHINV